MVKLSLSEQRSPITRSNKGPLVSLDGDSAHLPGPPPRGRGLTPCSGPLQAFVFHLFCHSRRPEEHFLKIFFTFLLLKIAQKILATWETRKMNDMLIIIQFINS